MRFLRILPAVWAIISWSFSSLTRKVALGSNSTTNPGNSSSSSFDIRLLVVSPRRRRRTEPAAGATGPSTPAPPCPTILRIQDRIPSPPRVAGKPTFPRRSLYGRGPQTISETRAQAEKYMARFLQRPEARSRRGTRSSGGRRTGGVFRLSEWAWRLRRGLTLSALLEV